jgi:hypothetical protein
MRDVSSTSPISVASRFVSSAIRERKAARWSAFSSRQRSSSVRAAPITAAIGLRSSWETSDTKSARSADRRRSSATVARSDSYARMFWTLLASSRPRSAASSSSSSSKASARRRRIETIPIGRVPSSSGAATRELRPIAVSGTSSG